MLFHLKQLKSNWKPYSCFLCKRCTVCSVELIMKSTFPLPGIIYALWQIATENFNKQGEALLTDKVLLTSEKLCHITKKSVLGCTIILAPNFNYCLNNGTKEQTNQSGSFFFHQEEWSICGYLMWTSSWSSYCAISLAVSYFLPCSLSLFWRAD